jgi:hypothetical protein
VGLDFGGEALLGDRLKDRLQEEAVFLVEALAGLLAPFQPLFEDFSRDTGGLGGDVRIVAGLDEGADLVLDLWLPIVAWFKWAGMLSSGNC